MTRANLRARLHRLEEQLEAEEVEVIRIWWADTDAGLWREGTAGEEGETRPIEEKDLEEIRASGAHVVILTGLPQRGQP